MLGLLLGHSYVSEELKRTYVHFKVVELLESLDRWDLWNMQRNSELKEYFKNLMSFI